MRALEVLAPLLVRLKLRKAFRADKLSEPRRLALLDKVVEYAETTFRDKAQGLLDKLPKGDGPVGGAATDAVLSWHRDMAGALSDVLAAGAYAVLGPDDFDPDEEDEEGGWLEDDEELGDLDDLDEDETNRRIRLFGWPFLHARQQAFLLNRRDAILSGQQARDGTLVARAGQYGSSVWGTALNALLAHQIARAMTEAKRILGGCRHCNTCLELEAEGWMPIDDMPPIGDSECKSSCCCVIVYR